MGLTDMGLTDPGDPSASPDLRAMAASDAVRI
jgi:hypothetical protein